ncbi:MAG: type-F conjugative transfer system secretin TraK [Sulfurimonadaceae bacterium]
MTIKSKMLLLMVLATQTLFAGTQIIDNLNDTKHISLSRSDVNRLVFPSPIKFQANSKEKDLTISVVDNEMYIKFTPYVESEQTRVKDQVVETGEPKIIYHKAKASELFVVTENKTYSLIVHPKKQDATTIIFTESFQEKKEEIFANKEMEYVSYISNGIIKELLVHKKIKGFTKSQLNNEYSIIKMPELKADLAYKAISLHSGHKFDVYEYEIKNINTFAMSIPDVKNILHKINAELQRKIKAYTIFYDNRIYKMLPSKSAKLILVVDAEIE